ncbi:unnamed protein product [Rotaria socialis]
MYIMKISHRALHTVSCNKHVNPIIFSQCSHSCIDALFISSQTSSRTLFKNQKQTASRLIQTNSGIQKKKICFYIHPREQIKLKIMPVATFNIKQIILVETIHVKEL